MEAKAHILALFCKIATATGDWHALEIVLFVLIGTLDSQVEWLRVTAVRLMRRMADDQETSIRNFLKHSRQVMEFIGTNAFTRPDILTMTATNLFETTTSEVLVETLPYALPALVFAQDLDSLKVRHLIHLLMLDSSRLLS